MSTSACIITWNEQEMLPTCLKFLDSLKNLDEICIVDSDSSDDTIKIVEDFKNKTKKEVKFLVRTFDNFSNQRNKSVELATKKWCLFIDADETYSQCLDLLLGDLSTMDNLKKFNAIRVLRVNLIYDQLHYLDVPNKDPQIRVWRKGFASFRNKIHECLFDHKNRNLHCVYGKDVLDLHSNSRYKNIVVKHHQLLKSDEVLTAKGVRWDDLKMLEESCKRGIPIGKNTWVEWKNSERDGSLIKDLPNGWYDATTKGGSNVN